MRIPAKAIEGEANIYLVAYLARVFGLRKNEVVLEKGLSSKHKRVNIYLTEEEFEKKLQSVV